LYNKKTNKKIAGKTEDEVYSKLGLKTVPPELREYPESIELAEKSKIPKLIDYNSLKGDFHVHTNNSDGNDSLIDMVAAAKNLGYEYVAITDHSQSERIANGNSPEQMLEEIKKIRELDKKTKGIKLFAGSEVDILPDGSLDFEDEILKKLDIVVASVHSRFKSPEKEMTERICTALDNKYIDILGHPTGRLINRREPYQVNMKKVFESAVKNKVVLEINSQPDRMDLKDVHVKQAKDLGALFAINSDSHSASSLQLVEYGLAIARRGWLEKKNIANTQSLKDLHKFFRKIRD